MYASIYGPPVPMCGNSSKSDKDPIREVPSLVPFSNEIHCLPQASPAGKWQDLNLGQEALNKTLNKIHPLKSIKNTHWVLLTTIHSAFEPL